MHILLGLPQPIVGLVGPTSSPVGNWGGQAGTRIIRDHLIHGKQVLTFQNEYTFNPTVKVAWMSAKPQDLWLSGGVLVSWSNRINQNTNPTTCLGAPVFGLRESLFYYIAHLLSKWVIGAHIYLLYGVRLSGRCIIIIALSKLCWVS